MDMKCPFCQKKVEDINEKINGCKSCIEKWIKEKNVDHPVF